LIFYWKKRQMLCVDSAAGREYQLTGELLGLLEAAERPMPIDELAKCANVPSSLISHLVTLGILLPQHEAEDLERKLALWSLPELATYRLADTGSRRANPFVVAMPSDRISHTGRRIRLTSLDSGASLAFADVLRARRSRRVFNDIVMPLEDLASLLIAAGRVQSEGAVPGTSFRPSPSGGARHPLEMYVLPLRVQGLRECVHHFSPYDGALVEQRERQTSKTWLAQALEREAVAGEGRTSIPAAAILLLAAFQRTQWKYESSLAMVYRDTGALMQTLYLQSTAMGLAGYVVGGGPQSHVLGDEQDDPLALGYVGSFLVGHPAESERTVGRGEE
jgi:SagB-type dehydrogenase family enzyme